MRTKAYKRLIEEGMAAGEIPEDIGRTILSRIESCGKMTPEIYDEFTAALAGAACTTYTPRRSTATRRP